MADATKQTLPVGIVPVYLQVGYDKTIAVKDATKRVGNIRYRQPTAVACLVKIVHRP